MMPKSTRQKSQVDLQFRSFESLDFAQERFVQNDEGCGIALGSGGPWPEAEAKSTASRVCSAGQRPGLNITGCPPAHVRGLNDKEVTQDVAGFANTNHNN